MGKIFNEDFLREEIAGHWGEHGAHIEVYDELLKRSRQTPPQNILAGVDLFYPQAREWMWDYCVYLGPFVLKDGTKLDLGIHMGRIQVSAAIVYGNEPGEYISGGLNEFGQDEKWNSYEYYEETRRRARALGLF